jgi:hypothetical protein
MPVDTIRLRASSWRQIFLLALAAATVLALMEASQSQAWYALHGGQAPPWSQSLSWSLAQWYAWAVFVPLMVLAGLRFSFGGDASILGRSLLHAGFGLLFALLHLLLQACILWLLPGGREFLGGFVPGVETLLITTLQWELLSYAAELADTHVWLYLRRAQPDALTRRELETRAAQAQLSALKRQMQPHFLFSALNALVAMQPENSAAQRFTIRLSEMLRMLLDSGDRTEATLADELRLVEAYLHVERARLGSRLQANVDVPDALGGTVLPALILQPLVENAVTHCVARDPSGGRIDVSAQRDGANVIIEIANSGLAAAVAPPNRGNGMALDNCRRRIALMFGAEARLETGPTGANGYRTALVLPQTVDGAAA